MKKIILSLLLFILVSISALAQSIEVDVKKFNAKQAFDNDDYATALNLYNQVLVAKPQDAAVSFHIGECYQEMDDYQNAVTYYEKAEKLDPNCDDDLHLKLGQMYIEEVQLDNALKEFDSYKKKFADSPKKLKDADIDHFITQCENAKMMMANPVKVTVTNVGEVINTSYDEKGPSVTADGRTMIFTSQRPIRTADKSKSNDPQPLFDNVYISKWDSAKARWDVAYPAEGDVNEPNAKTACTSISADGMEMFLYKNNDAKALGGDIYVSRKGKTGRWGKPEALGKPVNTSYYEDCASLSADGNNLYFMSERPGGYGHGDIYVSARIDKNTWGDPVNLGGSVNTAYDEGGISIAPDGKTLFFSSNSNASMGSYDIFKTVMTDSGKWSKPMNLGYPINTVDADKSFTISADCKTAYLASNRPGGMGARDIYVVDLSQFPVLAGDNKKGAPVGMSILRGKITGGKDKPIAKAEITISDSTNNKVAGIKTDAEGVYFITLKANSKYKVKVSASGYKPYTAPIRLPSAPVGTYTMTEDIVMEK
jgi:tetratricopeptide (TPR) repeat protein